MATQVVTRVIDDIDQTVLGENGEIAGERIQFAYQGKTYQLDLKPEHAAEFHRLLAYWVEHAIVIDPPKPKAKSKAKPKAGDEPAEVPPPPARPSGRTQRPGIRKWAIEQGFPVSPRGGRLPLNVIEAYDREAKSA